MCDEVLERLKHIKIEFEAIMKLLKKIFLSFLSSLFDFSSS